MRILGIDHGGRRIGLAISDSLGMIAHGLPTLTRVTEEEAVAHVAKLVAEREVDEVVVGLPRNMDDSVGPQAQKAMQFAEKLRAIGKPVHLSDERLTSERAHRVMSEAGLSWQKQRQKVDRMAAQFILQTWLDARKQGPDEHR